MPYGSLVVKALGFPAALGPGVYSASNIIFFYSLY
jgi:hypothetical protein